ncbi:hypothetical protein [Larkinella humicola]|uniref:hypothetical protein n=1 Tax=Larkinella humicola TaxID=2607654 RepID=UPI001CDA156E|nr:hypothetical protein [Larkinella humicola]
MIKGMILSVLVVLALTGYRVDTMSKRNSHQSVAVSAVAKDSAAAARAVVKLLNWYKNHIDSVSRIILVDQKPGKPYAVNFKNGEKYLAYLRSSHLLTNTFLNEWRIYFRQRQQGFQLTQQNEGPPTGFEYDFVLLSQEVDLQLESLNKLKITKVTVRKDRASVAFDLLASYECKLVRTNGVWLINEILNLSAE